eukprot:353437-Chlamydomonas_euryale.AAC.5
MCQRRAGPSSHEAVHPTCWGFLNSKGAKFEIASRQACLSKARFAAAARMPCHVINIVWSGSLRKSHKVLPPPEPEPLTPGLQSISQENLRASCHPALTSVVPCGHLPQLALFTSSQKPAATNDPHSFAMRVPPAERSVYDLTTPARSCRIAHLSSQACGGLLPWRGNPSRAQTVAGAHY